MELNKLQDESELQYIWRLGLAKDSGEIDLTWEELADVFNKNLRADDFEYQSSSTYRKKFNIGKLFRDEVFSKELGNRYLDELNEKKRELERAKIQYRDERNAWQRQNYLDARVEQKLDCLSEELRSIGRVHFNISDNDVKITDGNSDLLIILSDTHFGQTFSSAWGEYNTDIAKDRLNQYLEEIRKIQMRHGSSKAYLSIQGDLISGSIHKSLAVTNREDVISQIKISIEFISSFILQLSEWFEEVIVTNVSGNHSRIDRKEDALHSERLDDLIGWTVKQLLASVSNVRICDNNIDNGIAYMNIRGKEYINLHGDYDSFSKNGISNLCMMLGYIPYAVTFGHLHTCTVDDMQGVKAIRGGSLAGCGDQYTIEQRLKGKPSQMVCVCSNKGVECFYPVELR